MRYFGRKNESTRNGKYRIYPVILCGGAGSRLWPLSRELHPKPFIQLPDGQSLLQKAFCVQQACGHQRNSNHYEQEIFFKVDHEFSAVNKEAIPTSFILEPCKRDTAAAVAASALYIAEKIWRRSHCTDPASRSSDYAYRIFQTGSR